MDGIRRWGGCFLFLFVAIALISAEDELVLTDGNGSYSFSGQLRVVRDPANNQTFSTVRPLLDQARPLPDAEPNFGFTADKVWCLTRLANRSRQTDFFLYFSFNLDAVTIYYYEEGRPETMRTLESGAFVPPARKAFPHRLPVFPLRLEPGKNYALVMAVASNGTVAVTPALYSASAFDELNHQQDLFFGLMFGVLAGLILYILVIILRARTTNYIFYIIFAVSHLVFQSAYNGFLGHYLLPEQPAAVEVTFIVSIVVTLAAGVIFAMVFLETRRNAPLFHKAFIGFMIGAAAAVPLALFGHYRPGIILANTLLLASAVLITLCSLRMYAAGNRSARWYMLAYFSLIVSVFILTLKNYGLVPSNFFTAQSVLFGSVVESVLISLAIADRLHTLRFENKGMQTELLERRENEIRILKEKYYIDSMTGMENRNRLVLDLQKGGQWSLFIVNIDHFRQVNDLYGTIIGNQVIIETARRLKANGLSRPHSVYRLQSDEFALVVPEELPALEMTRIAEQLHRACQERPYIVDLYVIPLSVTIGVAGGSENILNRADMALSYARETHQEYLIYCPDFDMSSEIKLNLACLQLLRTSIDQGMVYPVFQPILNNATNKIEKYETLMRLRDVSGRSYTPGEFLSVAKRSKLYPQLSRLLIKKGIDFFAPRPQQFSLNLSVKDILDRESMRLIWECVERHPHKANIAFEILESESIEAYDPVARFIQEAKGRGCQVALDDFGSGYSNFDHLLRLNVDYLKIDGSLVSEMHTDKNARLVVETIVQFARRLKVKTVAEFVHCQEVFNLVRYLGINYSQGAYIGLPQEELVPEAV